jgi:hypothetical protein
MGLSASPQSAEFKLYVHQPELPWYLSDSVTIDLWKFYLCDMGCNSFRSGGCLLIDKDTVIKIQCELNRENDLFFRVGVDSMTQAHPDFTGDLSPLKNMYWTWHSGFIQLKAEGKILKSNGSWLPFQLHLGGFRRFPTDQLLHFIVNSDHAELKWDEDRLAQVFQLNSSVNIMSECQDASRLMSKIVKCIQVE